MKMSCVLLSAVCVLSSCSTMNESLQLGASMGTLVGSAATFAGHAGSGDSPKFGDVALGAGIGLGIGVLTSYLIHKDVEEKRQTSEAFQTDMYFGDLPPSPFAIPSKAPMKKGVR